MSKRLDARYDWLPSPSTTLAKYGHLLVVSVGDACDGNMFTNVKDDQDDYLALVSMEGAKCSYFTKVSSFPLHFSILQWDCRGFVFLLSSLFVRCFDTHPISHDPCRFKTARKMARVEFWCMQLGPKLW